MHRIGFVLALFGAAVVVGLAHPSNASAGWCWPTCSSNGTLGPGTSTHNGCWYPSAVCTGWGYWQVNGVWKACFPTCSWGETPGQILYGFENGDRIRGRFTSNTGTRYIRPADVAMGGYLRAQVTWWSGAASLINVAVIG